MHMLVDPVLCAWVPGWVVEQYERWNPDFRGAVRYALSLRRSDARGAPPRARSNAHLLRIVQRRMLQMQAARNKPKEESDASGSGSDERPDSVTSGDEDPAAAAARLREDNEIVRDPAPTLDGLDEAASAARDDWEGATPAQRLSA